MVKQTLEVDIVQSVVRSEEPLGMFQGRRIRGEADVGQFGRHQAAASTLTYLKRLRHRSEIRFQAAGHRGSQCERRGGAVSVEP